VTEEQSKMLYETHAKVTNGLTADVKYIKENMVTKEVCTAYRHGDDKVNSTNRQGATKWIALIAFLGTLALGMFRILGY